MIYTKEDLQKIIDEHLGVKIYFNVTDNLCFKLGDANFEFFKDVNLVKAIEEIIFTEPYIVACVEANIRKALEEFFKTNKQQFN